MGFLGTFNILDKARERITDALRSITTDHAYIHDGKLFTVPVFISALAAGATSKITFTTPATATGKYTHYRPANIVTSGDKVTVNLYEESSGDSGGTAVTPINRLRVHPIASLTEVKTGVTVTTNGLLIDKAYVGGGVGTGQARSGSETQAENEIVLKQETLHTIEIINGSGSANNIFVMLKWYEEDNA